jgi:hypothetical protein
MLQQSIQIATSQWKNCLFEQKGPDSKPRNYFGFLFSIEQSEAAILWFFPLFCVFLKLDYLQGVGPKSDPQNAIILHNIDVHKTYC